MITGLPIEFAHARIGARLGRRPDERLWQHLHAARSVPALLDAVRASAASAYVSGIALPGTVDSIDVALRTQLRAHIQEAAAWAHDAWRPAVRWTQHLIDLPALLHLFRRDAADSAAGAAAPRWIAADPVLAAYAVEDRAERLRLLQSGPAAPLAAALREPAAEDAPSDLAAFVRLVRGRPSGEPSLHAVLDAWADHWRSLWPAASGEDRAALASLQRAVALHVARFGTLKPEDANPAREALGQRARRLLRQYPAQPVALFAYLLLVALDIERLRGEFLLRAADAERAREQS